MWAEITIWVCTNLFNVDGKRWFNSQIDPKLPVIIITINLCKLKCLLLSNAFFFKVLTISRVQLKHPN